MPEGLFVSKTGRKKAAKDATSGEETKSEGGTKSDSIEAKLRAELAAAKKSKGE